MADKATAVVAPNILTHMLSEDNQLVQDYLIDGEGRLKLYHPVTQQVLFEILKANGLMDVLKSYDAAQESCETC